MIMTSNLIVIKLFLLHIFIVYAIFLYNKKVQYISTILFMSNII